MLDLACAVAWEKDAEEELDAAVGVATDNSLLRIHSAEEDIEAAAPDAVDT